MSNHCAKREYRKTDLALKTNPDNFGFLVEKDLKDVQPVGIGKAKLPPGQQTQISTPSNSVHLFYSCEGGGSFLLENQWYQVKEHDFFVLPPGSVVLLCADIKTGCVHRWINFTGTICLDFISFPTVFSLPGEFTATLYDPTEKEPNLSARLAGDLYHIYAKMQTPKDTGQSYVQTVINRIRTSYMEKLTVTEMAKELNLDRGHLSRLFKSRMGVTIQEYILHFRITKAKQCLQNGHSVSNTALLCGFGDRVNFSRVFLKETGCRPTEWLKYIKQDSYNKPR